MKKIFLLSLSIAGLVFAGQLAFAAENSVLYLSPTGISSAVGKSFITSVQLDSKGNQVCVVKGTLVFNNLSCQNIAVSGSLTPQTTPTCQSPSFVLGIPKCASGIKNLLTVTAKGSQAGVGNITLAGVKVIGVGVDVGYTLSAGAYTIAAPTQSANQPAQQQPAQQKPAQQEPEQQQESVTQDENQNETALADGSNQALVESQQASIANSSPTKTITIVAIVLSAMAAVGGAWYFFGKKKSKIL